MDSKRPSPVTTIKGATYVPTRINKPTTEKTIMGLRFGDELMGNGARIFTREAAEGGYETLVTYRNHLIAHQVSETSLFDAGRIHERLHTKAARQTREQMDDQHRATRELPRCSRCSGETIDGFKPIDEKPVCVKCLKPEE